VRTAGFDLIGLFQEHASEQGDDQRDTEHIEGVAEGQDEGLLLDDMSDRDIGAMHGVNAVDDAVVYEIFRELLDPAAGRLLEQRNRLRQDVRMILLALGQERIPAVATAESGANTRA
jgi:hypothetical protein